jgi:hypothetical protein
MGAMQIAHSRREHDDVAGRLEVAQDQLTHGASVWNLIRRPGLLRKRMPRPFARHDGRFARDR